MDALQINLYVSDWCDKGCPDCYYPKGLGFMDPEMAGAVVLWICNLLEAEQVKALKVHFLGGEPLTKAGMILKIVDEINLHRPPITRPHPDGEFVIFTNGDRLNPLLLDDLKQRKIRIMVNPCHDRLEKIESKIILIKSYMKGCSLAIALDDYNLDRLPWLTRLAVKHRCHVRTNRLYHGGNIPGYVEKYQNKMKEMFNLLLDSEWAIWPNFIMESTYPTWAGPKNPNSCGRWLLVIDPDGSIRSCNADLDTKIGSIYTHRRMEDFKFSHRWSAKNLSECQGCEWATWCQGGCPFTRKLTWNTYDRKSPFCEAFKKLFPDLIKIKRKWESKVEIQ